MIAQQLQFVIASKYWLAAIVACFFGFVAWMTYITVKLRDVPKRSELPALFDKFMEEWSREE